MPTSTTPIPSLFFLSSLFCPIAMGANSIGNYPERLSLSYVVHEAQKSSDLLRSVDAQKISWDSPSIQAQSLYTPGLFFGARKQDDRNEPVSAYSFTQSLSTEFFAGVQQVVPWSATQFRLEVSQGKNQYGSTGLTGTSTTTQYGARVRASASQSLLQSLWLGAERSQSLLGESQSKSNQIRHSLEYDQALLKIVQIYYRAWLGQADVFASVENFENKKKLLNITQLKLRRGTAERPDLLYAQSGLKSAELQLDETRRVLTSTWKSLVTQLGLPQEFLKLDPLKIPVDLDLPMSSAQGVCQNRSQNLVSREGELANLNANSAQHALGTLSARDRMDLLLSGEYSPNGLDPTSTGEAWKSTLRRDYPAWRVELQAKIPLGSSPVAGDYLNAKTNSIRAQATADQHRIDDPIQLEIRCEALEAKIRAQKNAKEIFDLRSERLRLEENRFEVGRAPLSQVLIASDDRVLADLSLKQSEIDQRLAAWDVLTWRGDLIPILLQKSPAEATP